MVGVLDLRISNSEPQWFDDREAALVHTLRTFESDDDYALVDGDPLVGEE